MGVHFLGPAYTAFVTPFLAGKRARKPRPCGGISKSVALPIFPVTPLNSRSPSRAALPKVRERHPTKAPRPAARPTLAPPSLREGRLAVFQSRTQSMVSEVLPPPPPTPQLGAPRGTSSRGEEAGRSPLKPLLTPGPVPLFSPSSSLAPVPAVLSPLEEETSFWTKFRSEQERLSLPRLPLTPALRNRREPAPGARLPSTPQRAHWSPTFHCKSSGRV